MSEEIVTINVIEASENVVINVYEGKEQTDWNETNPDAASYLKNKPTIDDTVTETSQNAVKSNGIWSWAKGLFTPKNPAETESDTLTDESVFQFWKGELKKITWANIKAALRTYFDTIYSTFSGSYNDLSHKPTIPSNAAQITVSDPVTPDFTPAVQGNNLQQVTNKVAGLQNPNLIIDYTVPANASGIILDTDRFGNPLNITTGERIIVVFEHSFVDESGNPANNRCFYRINNIYSRDYRVFGANSVSFQLLSASGYIHYTTFQLIVDGYVHGFGSNNGELVNGSLFGGGMNYFSLIKEVTALNSLRIVRMDSSSNIKAGSIVKIYKL